MNDVDNYKMIPNIAVQDIRDKNKNITQYSFVQLYGKKIIAYLYMMLEFQNNKSCVNFTINMLCKMLGANKNNISRERTYLKDVITSLAKNQLINIILINNKPIVKDYCLGADDVITLELNILEIDKDKAKKYFMLMDSEYSLIMTKCSVDLDKYNVLNLFCNIKSRINKNKKDVACTERKYEVAYPTYKIIKEDIFLQSDKTLKQYIDELVKLDLIRVGYVGDKIIYIDEKPIRKNSAFTYILFRKGWETELKDAISDYKNKAKNDGWTFLSKEKEFEANIKRSTSQKIIILEKKETLTISDKKKLSRLKREQENWKYNIDTNVDVRKLEEDKLKKDNPNKTLTEVYIDMGYEAKADRAEEEQLKSNREDKLPWEEEELCSCCGKNPVVKDNSYCQSCIDDLEESQNRAERWKLNNITDDDLFG